VEAEHPVAGREPIPLEPAVERLPALPAGNLPAVLRPAPFDVVDGQERLVGLAAARAPQPAVPLERLQLQPQREGPVPVSELPQALAAILQAGRALGRAAKAPLLRDQFPRASLSPFEAARAVALAVGGGAAALDAHAASPALDVAI